MKFPPWAAALTSKLSSLAKKLSKPSKQTTCAGHSARAEKECCKVHPKETHKPKSGKH